MQPAYVLTPRMLLVCGGEGWAGVSTPHSHPQEASGKGPVALQSTPVLRGLKPHLPAAALPPHSPPPPPPSFPFSSCFSTPSFIERCPRVGAMLSMILFHS